MTGYTVHTGSTGRFSEGWDRIFGRSTQPSAAKASSQPKSAKKPAAGKRPKGKK